LKRRRFLVFAQGGYADGLRAVPFIRALRQAEPGARIAVLGYEFARELWSSCPYVDDFIATGEDSILGRGWGARLRKIGRIARITPKLAARFDVFLNLEVQPHGGFPAVLPTVSLIPLRVGHGGPRYGMNLSPGVADMTVPYEVRMSELLQLIGVEVIDTRLEAWCEDGDRQAIRRLLAAEGGRSGGPLVVCHVGSDWSCQMWPAKYWTAVAKELVERHDAQVVFTGTQAEKTRVAVIASHCGSGTLELCGRTTFGQLCALLEVADLVISGDTLPAPLAVAMGTQALTLTAYDTSNWSPLRLLELNAICRFEVRKPTPWSVRCHWDRIGRVHGCQSDSCVGVHGMGRIQPDEVLTRATALLKRRVAMSLGASL
jgi:ADP-heptose:LPS heptosyltransferase